MNRKEHEGGAKLSSWRTSRLLCGFAVSNKNQLKEHAGLGKEVFSRFKEVRSLAAEEKKTVPLMDAYIKIQTLPGTK